MKKKWRQEDETRVPDINLDWLRNIQQWSRRSSNWALCNSIILRVRSKEVQIQAIWKKNEGKKTRLAYRMNWLRNIQQWSRRSSNEAPCKPHQWKSITRRQYKFRRFARRKKEKRDQIFLPGLNMSLYWYISAMDTRITVRCALICGETRRVNFELNQPRFSNDWTSSELCYWFLGSFAAIQFLKK